MATYTLTPEQAAQLSALNTPNAQYVPCYGDSGIEASDTDFTDPAFAAHLTLLQTFPKTVPFEITAVQGRLELIARGMYADIQVAVATMPEEAQVTYEYATTWRRQSALVEGIGHAKGLTDAEMDEMFISAAAR